MSQEPVNQFGFSARAQNEDFRQLMRKQVSKNFRYILISLPIVFVFVTVIAVIVCKTGGYDWSIALGTDALVIVIMLVILAVNFWKYRKSLKNLNKDSIDGVIHKTSRYVSDTDGKVRKTHYRIVFQSEDGKKIKLKDSKASVYYYNVEKGDRVRYHPGFVYPLELFDKQDANICVFCGKKNDADKDQCQICKKPMLI